MKDSLEGLEAHRQYRQQFLENRSKCNHIQALPSTPKSQTVKHLSSVSQNYNTDADRISFCSEKLLFVPPTDEIDAADTLFSSVSSGDKSYVANSLPLPHQKSRSVTPISELIQRFTSEILKSEISSLKHQTQSSVEGSLEFKPNNDTHTSQKLTEDPLPHAPVTFSSALQTNTTVHDIVRPVVLAVPLRPSNVMIAPESSFQHSYTENDGATLRRPSFFQRREGHDTNSARSSLQQSLMTDTGMIVPNGTASLHMPPTSIAGSGVLETIEHSPQVARRVQIATAAIPFKPPNWVKFPETSVSQTDAAPPQNLLPYSGIRMAGSSTQPSFVTRTSLTRASSFNSYPVTEGSTSSEAFTSSLPYLNGQKQRRSDFSIDQNSYERITRQSIQANKAPNITLSSYKPSTYSGNISERKSPNHHEHNSLPLHSSTRFVRRSSTSSLISSPRRSQTPSIPVKTLVKKFSANN